jgi:cytochrome P450
MRRPDPRLPPGPATGALRQTVLLHRDPLGTLRALQAAHGDVFTMRLATARPLVVVAAPEEVRPLLRADPAGARAGTARRAILPLASPRSVWGSDEPRHTAARAPLEASFGAEAVSSARAGMAEIAERHALSWPRGRPLRLLPRVRALVDEIFVRLVLRVDDERRAAAIAAALRRMLWTPGNPPLSVPGEGDGLMGALGRRAFDRRHGPLSKLVAAEAERRRDGDGLLGSLARAGRSGAEVADELLVVLAAAQEPPAIALTRVLERAAHAPEADAALAAGGAPRDAVVRETLRLHPPVLANLRRLAAPREVAGHALPAGAIVMLPIPLLHRDARAFPEPDAFRPERWAGSAGEIAPFAPFGDGARRCVGEYLSQAYFDAVVPAILRRLRLRPVPGEPERMVVRGTTLVPLRSGVAVATLRGRPPAPEAA